MGKQKSVQHRSISLKTQKRGFSMIIEIRPDMVSRKSWAKREEEALQGNQA
jgi:hypothetical protein